MKESKRDLIRFIGISIVYILLLFIFISKSSAQTIGKTETEQYKASFETKTDISQYLNYNGEQIPVQILKCGISDEMYDQYPELKEKRVGLGVANITLEYLENLNRFSFTEDKTEIKNRMVQQFKASQSGISQDKLDGRGKIRLAHYFVEIECYDYSVSEDETVNLKDGVKNLMVTRLGLQVRFTDAETGEIIAASGLGEAKTTRELTLLSDATVDPVKFNQSTISISTKKALDIACSRILGRMIKKGVFKN
jgi:DNA-binding XRE family transcriptional regulator